MFCLNAAGSSGKTPPKERRWQDGPSQPAAPNADILTRSGDIPETLTLPLLARGRSCDPLNRDLARFIPIRIGHAVVRLSSFATFFLAAVSVYTGYNYRVAWRCGASDDI